MSMAQIATRKALTLAGADMVTQAAEAYALARGAKVVIAVVDGFGKPIVLRRPVVLAEGGRVACVGRAPDPPARPSAQQRTRVFASGLTAVTLRVFCGRTPRRLRGPACRVLNNRKGGRNSVQGLG